MFYVLGLQVATQQAPAQDNTNKLLDLVADIRTKLRAEKQYALSDYIRDQLAAIGVAAKDKKI